MRGIERRMGSVVFGGIWELQDFHWVSLDQYEAVDQGFLSKSEDNCFCRLR